MRDSQVSDEKVECVLSLWSIQDGEWVNVDGGRESLKVWRENAVKGVPSELRANIGNRVYSTKDHTIDFKTFANQCKQDAGLTYDKIADSYKFSHEVPSPLSHLFASNFKKQDKAVK